MKIAGLFLAAAVVVLPIGSFAHGQAPVAAHGGQVQDAHGNWVELVVHGDQVEVYVMDEHGKPVPASQVSGTASVIVDGQLQKAELSPAEGNELKGKLAAPVTGRLIASVSLKIGGKAATARFATAG